MENNIDKIFRSKLATRQEKPSEEAWAKLEEVMYGKQIKRRSIAVYWQVAAAIALLLVASFFYFGDTHEDSLATTVKDKNQKIEEKQTPKQSEATAVETYQPIQSLTAQNQVAQNQSLPKEIVAKKELAKTNEKALVEKKAEGKMDEKTLLEEVANTKESVNETVPKKEVESLVTSLQTTENQESNLKKEEILEDIKITVKFVEDESEAEDTKQQKKTWLGKMVSNIKKKRQREQAEENEDTAKANVDKEDKENKEKAGIFVFGIDTEKIFTKKKSGE